MARRRNDVLARRKASVELLRDLEESRMKGVAQHHSGLSASIRKLDSEIAELEDWVKKEVASSAENPNLSVYFADFFRAIKAEAAVRETDKENLRLNLHSVEAEFRQAVRRVKTLEHTAGKAHAEISKNRERAKASARMESMIQQSHRRGRQ